MKVINLYFGAVFAQDWASNSYPGEVKGTPLVKGPLLVTATNDITVINIIWSIRSIRFIYSGPFGPY